MDCFQPCPKPDISDSIIEMTMKHFDITGKENKCVLHLLFDFYHQIKTKDAIVKAFSEWDKK